MTSPYPLVLTPILKPKVWGGRALERFGKQLPDSEPTGESWELADLDSTNPSGGGGDPAHSTIANGDLKGKTIRDAVELWGSALIDTTKLHNGAFPLLVKYLDAREHLSVQVHPSPAYADAHPDAHLKTESWVVLHAEPHAVLYKGLKPGTTKDDLRDAIEAGTVPVLLTQVPAVVGECHTLPSGTVHALGAGIVVAEVQTPSDTTYRVYDWAAEYGRAGRELHTDQAVECASTDECPGASDPAPAPSGPFGAISRANSAHTEYYTIESVRASCASVPLTDVSTPGPIVIMLLDSKGASIASSDDSCPETVLETGQTCLIPAACADTAELRAGPDTWALIARV